MIAKMEPKALSRRRQSSWMYLGDVAEGKAGYRFPPEAIHQAIWLYLRFTLSFRDVEDLLAERGIAVSYETVRRWVNHFGADDRRASAQAPSETACDLAS